MGRSFLSRLSAAAMAVYFLCAAILLPELDALVFHGAPAQESRVHIEATGTAACHAESCVLGATLPRGQRSQDFSPDIARLSDPAILTPPAVSGFADRTPPGTCTPRAPPTISAS